MTGFPNGFDQLHVRAPDVTWPAEDFNPFTDLYQAQSARPRHLRPVDFHTLTPLQRSLLVIDGTVTKLLEAYMLEPIDVVVLRQEMQSLQSNHPWLDCPAGTPVVAREVILRGRESGNDYIYAVSLLVWNRLPEQLVSRLETEPGGIGRALLASDLENRREVLWYGSEQADASLAALFPGTGGQFLSRSYRIIAHGHPVMLISEKFPMSSSAKTPPAR